MNKKLEHCQVIAESIGYKIEPAGMKHKYLNAINNEQDHKYVVKVKRPSYDVFSCRTIEELLSWLIERKEKLDGFEGLGLETPSNFTNQKNEV